MGGSVDPNVPGSSNVPTSAAGTAASTHTAATTTSAPSPTKSDENTAGHGVGGPLDKAPLIVAGLVLALALTGTVLL